MRVALIDGDNIPWVGAWLHRDNSDEEMFKGIDNYITDILINTKADKYIGFLQGSDDMRRTMFPDYKANRPPTPDWLTARKPMILDYLRLHWQFTYTQKGYESDDAIASVNHILPEEYIPIICSPDKDLKQIWGWNYNTRTKELTEIPASDAILQLCMQLLHGDTTDNIPNIKKGYGPATAKKVLLDENTAGIPLPYIALGEFLNTHGDDIGLVKFAENVLKVVLRRDPDYKFELIDVPENIKALYAKTN